MFAAPCCTSSVSAPDPSAFPALAVNTELMRLDDAHGADQSLNPES